MKDLARGLKEFALLLNDALKKGFVKGFALVGGMAVSARARPRATKDIDFIIQAEPEFYNNVLPREIIKRKLTSKTFQSDKLDPMNGLVRIYDSEGNELVDLIPVFFKWQNDIIHKAELVKIFETTIPVARIEDLVVMKLVAGGPQDMLDIRELLLAAKVVGIDEKRLLNLAKRARVDKKLAKMISEKI